MLNRSPGSGSVDQDQNLCSEAWVLSARTKQSKATNRGDQSCRFCGRGGIYDVHRVLALCLRSWKISPARSGERKTSSKTEIQIQLSMTLTQKRRFTMRSNLVFEAIQYVPNRYQLCQLASKAMRKMHRPHARIPDTTNYVLSSLNSFHLGSGSAVQACNVKSTKKRLAA